MKIHLINQQKNFPKHLAYFKSKKVMPYEKDKLVEKSSSIEIEKDFSKTDFSAFFDYEIFPKNIMTHLCEWKNENRKMKVGDTIVQQTFLPPNQILSQKMLFAVRINEIIDLPDKKSFSYETLEGHVEKGISSFTIEKNGDKCTFTIQTYSKPGNFLTRILGPIFSVPYQSYCTRKALGNVKENMYLREFNPTDSYYGLDMSIHQNQVLWHFWDLIKNLVTLSEDAPKQREIVGVGHVVDEMIMDFGDYRDFENKYLEQGFVNENQNAQIKKVQLFIEKMTLNYELDFWSPKKLESDSNWAKLREISKNALSSLGYENLEVFYKREVECSIAENGEEVFVERTSTYLKYKDVAK